MKNFPKFLTVEKPIVKEFMKRYPRYIPFIEIKGSRDDFVVFKITRGDKVKITDDGFCKIGIELFEDLDFKLKKTFFKGGTIKERVNSLIKILSET